MNKNIPVARKPTLYVMIGPAGSGKSTFAVSGKLDGYIISTDEIRQRFYGDEASQENPAAVFAQAYKEVRACLNRGWDVIFDATNTTHQSRKELLKRVADIPHRNVAVYMNTALEECKRRNAQRKRQVPDGVIDRQYMQMVRDAASIPVRFDEIVIVEGWHGKR